MYVEDYADPEVALTYSPEDSFKCTHCKKYYPGFARDFTFDDMCQECVYFLHELQTANA